MDTQTDQRLFRHLVQTVKDYAIFALDPSGHVISWNKGAERIKGYTADEIIGKHFSIFYPDEANAIKHPEFELAQAIKDGSYKEEGWRVRKDGKQFWAHVVITALFDDNQVHLGFAKVTRDLTERKVAEDLQLKSKVALEMSERAFQQMVEAVRDYAIFVIDTNGIITTWNEGAQRIKGYQAEEIIGKHFSTFYTEDALKIHHPQLELEKAIEHGRYEEEGWRLRKNGEQFWASVSITSIKLDGEIVGFLKVTKDLTERKLYEQNLKEARDQAIIANQLKSQFIANITHEIRTPLSSIAGLSELVSMEDTLDDETKQSAVSIFESSKLLLEMLTDMLDFAKLESGKVLIEQLGYSIRDVVKGVAALSQHKAEAQKLQLRVTIGENVPEKMFGDPSKLRQVLLNLINNAIKFTERGGVEVLVEGREDGVFVSVTDTGIGISVDDQEKLFQPFSQAHESTSRLYGGTGLGLSIAQQYVNLMGSQIQLFSEPGRGTTFYFILPTTKKASTESHE